MIHEQKSKRISKNELNFYEKGLALIVGKVKCCRELQLYGDVIELTHPSP
jgi:hypothetical protein